MDQEKCLKEIERQWKKMSLQLYQKTSPNALLCEDLHNQLVWLKQQINYCREEGNYQQLKFYYNEVAQNFNKKMKLKGKNQARLQ